MKVGPGTKDYGALSLAVQFYSKPEVILNVSANCFIPRPNVDSAVIKLSLLTEKIPVEDEAFMFALIRASFNQRRKTLVNGLTNAGINGVTKEAVLKAIKEMDLSETIRGEALTLEQFALLAFQAANGLLFDLAHTLTGEVEAFADFIEGERMLAA